MFFHNGLVFATQNLDTKDIFDKCNLKYVILSPR